MMVFIQSEKCHNDGVSRPPIRDNDLEFENDSSDDESDQERKNKGTNTDWVYSKGVNAYKRKGIMDSWTKKSVQCLDASSSPKMPEGQDFELESSPPLMCLETALKELSDEEDQRNWLDLDNESDDEFWATNYPLISSPSCISISDVKNLQPKFPVLSPLCPPPP